MSSLEARVYRSYVRPFLFSVLGDRGFRHVSELRRRGGVR
jgi:hypothetical protein